MLRRAASSLWLLSLLSYFSRAPVLAPRAPASLRSRRARDALIHGRALRLRRRRVTGAYRASAAILGWLARRPVDELELAARILGEARRNCRSSTRRLPIAVVVRRKVLAARESSRASKGNHARMSKSFMGYWLGGRAAVVRVRVAELQPPGGLHRSVSRRAEHERSGRRGDRVGIGQRPGPRQRAARKRYDSRR